jgi:hypothetical protein
MNLNHAYGRRATQTEYYLDHQIQHVTGSKRISGPETFGSSAKKDFFNSIRHEQTSRHARGTKLKRDALSYWHDPR